MSATSTATNSLFDDNYCREFIDRQDADVLEEIQMYPPGEQCQKLKRLFVERMKVLHCCREQLTKMQEEVNDTSRKHKRQIEELRSFWKDKVYGGNSRSGRMLKAILNKPYKIC